MIGERAHTERRRLNVNQDDIAKKVGVSGAYISRIERGNAPGVTLDVVSKLADALGVSVAYLMGYSEDPRGEVDVLKEEKAIFNTISPEEEELFDLIHAMTPQQRQQMLWGARLILGTQSPRIIE